MIKKVIQDTVYLKSPDSVSCVESKDLYGYKCSTDGNETPIEYRFIKLQFKII